MKRGVIWLGLAAWLGMIALPSARGEVTLQVTPIEGGRDLDFGSARSLGSHGEPEADTVIRRVRLTITPTSSGRYQIFQRVSEPWTNPAGRELPLQAVRFFISSTRTNGLVRFPSPTPLTLGEEEIFLSNESGGNEEILITYTIQVPPGQETGRYRTNLTFRVVSQ